MTSSPNLNASRVGGVDLERAISFGTISIPVKLITAHRDLSAADAPPDTEVLHLDGAPPMFTVSDSEGNTVILLQE